MIYPFLDNVSIWNKIQIFFKVGKIIFRNKNIMISYFTVIQQKFKCIIICNFRKKSRSAEKFGYILCDTYINYMYIIICYYIVFNS